MIRTARFSLLCICLCVASAVAQEPTPVAYEVDLTDANSHYVHISLKAESTQDVRCTVNGLHWSPANTVSYEYVGFPYIAPHRNIYFGRSSF